ncbi:MAG: hypothetical protein R2911_07625 [Caldilineaceae bacterium]
MVADGLICAPSALHNSPTSGYRILEHAYAELIQKRRRRSNCGAGVGSGASGGVPSGYVDTIPLDEWDPVAEFGGVFGQSANKLAGSSVITSGR